MPKPTVSLRRPPAPKALDAFVQGKPSSRGANAPGRQVARGKGILTRAGGRATRRMTAYVPPELAKRAMMFCASEGRQFSEIFEEALASYLAGQEAR